MVLCYSYLQDFIFKDAPAHIFRFPFNTNDYGFHNLVSVIHNCEIKLVLLLFQKPEFKGSPNYKIYIKADDRAIGAELSPCVSPEPEEQPMKKLRIDPKHDMLNRSSIAT